MRFFTTALVAITKSPSKLEFGGARCYALALWERVCINTSATTWFKYPRLKLPRQYRPESLMRRGNLTIGLNSGECGDTMTPNRQEKADIRLEKLYVGGTRLDAVSRKRHLFKQDISDLNARFLADGEGSWISPNGNSSLFGRFRWGLMPEKPNLKLRFFKNHFQTLALPASKIKFWIIFHCSNFRELHLTP